MTGRAIPTIEPLDFDSRMLGLACGRIDLSRQAKGAEPPAAESIIALLDDAHDYGLVLIKVPGENPLPAGRLISHGADLIDTELTLAYGGTLPSAPPDDAIVWTDQWPAADFLPLAEEMIHSRFSADPRIPRPKAVGLWRESIRNHCQGRSHILAVARQDDQPAGLVALVSNPPDMLNLFIVGVLPSFQGQGLGQRLVKAAAARFHPQKRIIVEALVRNTRALHCYQQAGFRLESLHYILHFWKKSA